MKVTTGKLPTHRLYAVEKRNGKNYWRPIGAAWAHSDGEGFGLKLDYLPLNGSEIVMRTPKADDEQDGQAAQEGGAQ